MTTLTIKDLLISKGLDHKAMGAVRGGQGAHGAGASTGWMPELPMNIDAMMGAFATEPPSTASGAPGGTAVSTHVSSTPSETGENHGYSTTTVTREY